MLIPVNTQYITHDIKGDHIIIGNGINHFPSRPENDDEYFAGDYRYIYTMNVLERGWRVKVLNKNKTNYGPILETICGENVTDLTYTFQNCIQMLEAPRIPCTVINMWKAFENATSLVRPPEIPMGVVTIAMAFKNCTSLKAAPEIPSSVRYMTMAFMNCTSMEGDFVCNAKKLRLGDADETLRNTHIHNVTGDCTDGVIKNWLLRGTIF